MENVACSLKHEGEADAELNVASKEQSDSSPPPSEEMKRPNVFAILAELSSDQEYIPEIESYFHIDELLDESPISDPKYLCKEDCPPLDEEAQRAKDSSLETSGLAQMLLSERNGTFIPENFEKITAPLRAALEAAGAAVERSRAETENCHIGDKTKETLESSDQVELETWINGALGIRPGKMSVHEKAQTRMKLSKENCIDEITARGETLLWLSCAYRYHDVAEFLLSMKADIENKGVKGTTPLMVAATNGHSSIVELLIKRGAEVNACTSREYLRKPASATGASVDDSDEEGIDTRIMSIIYPEGTTPLMYACAQGHKDVVCILLEAGAQVEDRNEEGRTALMEAASAKHVEIAKLLITHGANVKAHPDKDGNTALTLACASGALDLVSFLLEAGAIDHGHKIDELQRALRCAAYNGRIEIARLLLDTGAQVNSSDNSQSALLAAIHRGQVEMARFLLNEGAKIERMYLGLTPLMEAAREGDKDMVKLLLSHGANVNARTEAGLGVLSFAPLRKVEELREVLNQAGAKS